MSRAFCIPGIVFLFCAFVLSFLASISLPYLPALDAVRVKYATPANIDSTTASELRFGIWTACSYNQDEARTCPKSGYAYAVSVDSPNVAQGITIGRSWTRGLVVTPVATAVTFIALCLAFSTNLFIVLVTSLVAFLAAVLHLISFFIQIALFARVKDKMGDLELGASTKPGPGFWLVFVSLILCLLAGCTVCFGRRRDKNIARGAEAVGTTVPSEKGGFFSRFRK